MANTMKFCIFVMLAFVAGASAKSLSEKEIEQLCTDKLLTFKTTEQFQEFVESLSSLSEANNESRPKWTSICLDQLESILSLNAVIEVGREFDVCHPTHIDSLVQYDKEWIDQYDGKVVTAYFFEQYCRAVSLTCYQNLYTNVLESDRSFQAPKELEMCQVGSSNNLIGQIPHVMMTELEELMDSVSRPDQIELTRFMPPGLALLHKMPASEREYMEYQIRGCTLLSTHYENTLASISRLARIGFDYDFNSVKFYDETHQHQLLAESMPANVTGVLKLWLGITQVCDPILNQHIQYTKNGADKIKIVSLASINPRIKNHSPDATLARVFQRNNDDFPRNFATVIDGTVGANLVTDIADLDIHHFNDNASQELKQFLEKYVEDEDVAKTIAGFTRSKRAPDVSESEQVNEVGELEINEPEENKPLVVLAYVLNSELGWCALILPAYYVGEQVIDEAMVHGPWSKLTKSIIKHPKLEM